MNFIARAFVLAAATSSLALIAPSATADTVDAGRVFKTNEDRVAIVRGNHPRLEDLWLQYNQLGTPLRGNFFVSDVIMPDAKFTTFDNKPTQPIDVSKQTAENYDSSHNHYQNLLSEVINFRRGANAVAIWGDSAAVVNGSNSWGGFLSARSDCKLSNLTSYIPKGLETGCGPEFDAQLIGLEIDVLNLGKPGIFPNKSKTGLQVVGFGTPNSMAIEVRSEDTDRDVKDRRGVFESVLYVKNSLHSDYGRLIVADFDEASMGLDFRKAHFKNGAIQLRSEGLGTGVVFQEGHSGEVHGGLRWAGFEDQRQWLTLRAGDGGLRIASNDTTKELMAVDNHGGIYLNGDVYVKGAPLNPPPTPVGLVVLSALASSILTSIVFVVLLRRGLLLPRA